MDDVQPNERRLARKGSTAVPRVRPHRFGRHPPHKLHEHAPGGTPKRRPKERSCYLRANRRGRSKTPDDTSTRPHLINPHTNAEHACINRQGAVVPTSTKAGDIAQNNESRPSLVSRHRGSSWRLDDRFSVPSSRCCVRRELGRPSTPEMKSPQARVTHTIPAPRHRPPIGTAAPQIERTVDCPPSPFVKENSVRWSAFRSGYIDVCLPLSDDNLRASSSGSNAERRSSAPQELPHILGQHRNVPFTCGGGIRSHLSHPKILPNDIAPARPAEDRQIDGFLFDQPRQHDSLDSSRTTDCLATLESEAMTLQKSPHQSPSARGFALTCGKSALSLGSHDKPRRVLHDDNSAYIVTAHGVIDQVCATGVLRLDRNIRSPPSAFAEFVDDACILSHQGDPVVILAHARQQNQITVLNLGHDQVPGHIRLHHDWSTAKRAGISAVASMSPLKFASGGYDHRVHLWDIAQDLSSASAVELAIRHASLVHSLLPILDTSHKLVSVGADRAVSIYDLSAECVVCTLKTSCIPFHAHKTSFPFCTLLEVGHLETQFEVRDHRLSQQTVQRFGFTTEERRGRFEKGDTWSYFAVCGDKKGAIHVWDLRNVSTEVALQQCFKDPVVHVANTGPHLLACSKRNELVCIDSLTET